MVQRIIDYPCLPTMAYIPGEAFTIDVSFIAKEGEDEYLADDGYMVKFNWPGDENEQVFNTVTVGPLADPNRGVRVTLVVDGDSTADWPVDIRRGDFRILRGVGVNAATIGGGEMRPSRLARNVG